ncbi:hypothetical protein HZC09_00095 [Candidatus Micrarchaeota archaeon]|nr:hypothetical protein [Candidatus Micrarchaeota archaeon]
MGNDFELVRVFTGGSLARTLLVRENGVLKVRKEAKNEGNGYAYNKLQQQADWLKHHQRLRHVPKFLGERHADSYYSYDLQYYPSTSFFESIHSKPLDDSKKRFSDVLDFCFENFYSNETTQTAAQKKSLVAKLLKDKLFGKVHEALAANGELREFSAHKKIHINQDSYDNFGAITKKIMSDPKILGSLESFKATDLHGDLTIDNLLCTDDGFILIDPNPDNIVNTPLVDLSKVLQSLHSGYEFLIELDECQVLGNQVIFNAQLSSQYLILNKFFRDRVEERLDENEQKNLLFYEALNYSRMLPLKQRINDRTAPVFYAVMVKLLNEFYNQH